MDQEVVRAHPIRKEVRSGLKPGGLYGLGKYGTFDGNDFGDHIKSLMANQPTSQSHSSTRRPVRMATYWIRTALTGCSRCRWIRTSLWFIDHPRGHLVCWHLDHSVGKALQHDVQGFRLFDQMSCGDPQAQEQDLPQCQALHHLAIQRKRIDHELCKPVFKFVSNRLLIMGPSITREAWTWNPPSASSIVSPVISNQCTGRICPSLPPIGASPSGADRDRPSAYHWLVAWN